MDDERTGFSFFFAGFDGFAIDEFAGFEELLACIFEFVGDELFPVAGASANSGSIGVESPTLVDGADGAAVRIGFGGGEHQFVGLNPHQPRLAVRNFLDTHWSLSQKSLKLGTAVRAGLFSLFLWSQTFDELHKLKTDFLGANSFAVG